MVSRSNQCPTSSGAALGPGGAIVSESIADGRGAIVATALCSSNVIGGSPRHLTGWALPLTISGAGSPRAIGCRSHPLPSRRGGFRRALAADPGLLIAIFSIRDKVRYPEYDCAHCKQFGLFDL